MALIWALITSVLAPAIVWAEYHAQDTYTVKASVRITKDYAECVELVFNNGSTDISGCGECPDPYVEGYGCFRADPEYMYNRL